jgi:nucleotide-binding universal stress UspA family protein
MQTLVVGIRDEGESSRDAVALGVAAAATLGAELVFANVYPTAFDFPGGAVDAEWRRYLKERAEQSLAWARQEAGDPAGARYLSAGEVGSATGLAELAEALPAGAIILGSASGGRARRMFAGTTADRLFHGSTVPIAVAPQGFHSWAPPRFGRFVLAYQGTEDCRRTLRAASEVAQRAGADVHLVTLLERVSRIYGTPVARESESEMLERLAVEAGRLQADAIADCPEGVTITMECVRGWDAASAMAKVDWRDDDVLVVGSGRSGLLRRVFLGDMTFKIVHAAEVPVVVLPRSAAEPAQAGEGSAWLAGQPAAADERESSSR